MIQSIPILETRRTRMRGHTVQDFEASAHMWADAQVVQYISGTPANGSESWSRLLRYIGHWHAMGFGYWLVEDRETGTFLGEVGFANYKRQMTPPLADAPEIGWVLAPDAHGQGLATEAVTAALRWGDANLASDHTVCIFHPDHVASISVAKKNGYRERGTSEFGGQPTLVMERYTK